MLPTKRWKQEAYSSWMAIAAGMDKMTASNGFFSSKAELL